METKANDGTTSTVYKELHCHISKTLLGKWCIKI